MELTIGESTGIKGHMVLRTHTLRLGWDSMDPHELLLLLEVADADQEVEADNIMCVNGLSQMIQAFLWSSIADQNANMGSPYDAQFMYPIYGAIGTNGIGGGVLATDIQLNAEEARAICASAGATNASVGGDPQIVWSFLFGAPGGNQTIDEAGVFLCATATANNGYLLDHAVINPAVTQSTSQLLTLTVDITCGN
jgi:hypothetical protein